MASRGALKTRHHDSGYASLEEMRQALAAEGLPIDHLEEPKLIEHGCFADLKAGLARQRMDLRAQLLDAVLVVGDEVLPAAGGKFRHAVEPQRVELSAQIV